MNSIDYVSTTTSNINIEVIKEETSINNGILSTTVYYSDGSVITYSYTDNDPEWYELNEEE